MMYKTIRCESCEQQYKVEYNHNHPDYFYLKLKYSFCPLCYHPRTNEKPKDGQFQCIDCNIIYTFSIKRKSLDGRCSTCYMNIRRRKVNHDHKQLL